MSTLENIWQLMADAILLTAQLAVGFFGGIFVMGFLLYFLAKFTRNLFAKSFGYRSEIYTTAWIGTPVHELGHAIFCILFGHRIRKINLFKPNAKDGSLGSVEHSYSSRNIYQRTGNFFIGAGPLFSGSLLILVLIKFLLPNGDTAFDILSTKPDLTKTVATGFSDYFYSIAGRAFSVFPVIFSKANLTHWQFWLFLYLAIAVSSHMSLSPPDVKTMLSGLLTILVLMFVFNLAYLLFFSEYNNVLLKANSAFALLDRLLMAGLLLSIINFILTFVIATAFGILIRGKIPNPFTH